jgi:hypothetical protein
MARRQIKDSPLYYPPIIVARRHLALHGSVNMAMGPLPTVPPLEYLSGMERLRPHHGAK